MVLSEFLVEWYNDAERVLVHTSGSTGQPKPLWVEKRRMEESARITCDFLSLKPGDTALLCMPLKYIAGKMMVVRALVGKLKLITMEPTGHPLKDVDEDIDFAAMVPMQVYNSLQVPEEREKLRRIRHLIIGGGAVDDLLCQALKDFPNAVWSTYGMTETLSHIALRRLNGQEADDWYTPFPSVSVSLNEEDCLVIDAPKVCEEVLITNDRAVIEYFPQTSNVENGNQFITKFRILGRKDNVISCGGVKIQIEEVERLLRPHISIPFMITKRKDDKFGEIVALMYEAHNASIPQKGVSDAADILSCLQRICKDVLPKYWQPRLYLPIEKIPMTETGKPKRGESNL